MATITKSKGLLVAYWLVTGLLSALLAFAAFNHISGNPEMAASTAYLGFPARLMPFLGVLKIAAIITILVGRRNDLTTGAYAGLFFYGLGAVMTHLTIGDPVGKAAGGIIIILLSLGSYFLWKRTRGALQPTLSPAFS